jgi:hypothetical protein
LKPVIVFNRHDFYTAMTLLHFFENFKRIFHGLDVLPIDTRDHITVSQAQLRKMALGFMLVLDIPAS